MKNWRRRLTQDVFIVAHEATKTAKPTTTRTTPATNEKIRHQPFVGLMGRREAALVAYRVVCVLGLIGRAPTLRAEGREIEPCRMDF